jgi:regulator of sigma E protease
MSGIWVQVIQFVAALSLLIILHEGGHFFFAKLFKTRVEKFYLFFDFLFPFSNILPFSLFKKKKGETTYGIGWFPLGGYVKIAGMVDESMDKEQMKQPPQPWEFRSKPAWQRLLIMLGGIIVNVLLAFVIYAMVLFAWGQKRLPLSELKSGIVVGDSLAYNLGFKDGDQILEVNGKTLHYYDELMPELIYAKSVVVERDGRKETLVMPENFIEQLIDNKGRQLFFVPMPAIVGDVTKGSEAEKIGLEKDDQLIAVNGDSTSNAKKLRDVLKNNKDQEVQLSVLRDGKTLDMEAHVSDSGTLGFFFLAPTEISDTHGDKFGPYHIETTEYGFFASFPAGVKMGLDKLNFYVQQFKLILNPKTGAYKGLGGFDTIRKIYSQEWDWHHFWSVTAFLSLILAFMNFLPIPGLDGGYVLFTLIEMVSGRKINEKVLEVATTIGLVLLLILMVYANGMDILRIFQK